MIFNILFILAITGARAAPAEPATPAKGLVSCSANSKEIIYTVLLSKSLKDSVGKSQTVAACCSMDSDGLGDWLDSKGHFVCSKLKGPVGQQLSSAFSATIKPLSCTGGSQNCRTDANGCCFEKLTKKRDVTALANCPKNTFERSTSVYMNGELQKASTWCVAASNALSNVLTNSGDLYCIVQTNYAGTVSSFFVPSKP
jgi:hypothetical protein